MPQEKLDGFEEQEDAGIWIDWGQLGTNDDGTPHDKDRTYVVGKDEAFIGTVESVNESITYEGVKIVTWKLDDGRFISTLCPASLQDKLGLGKFKKKFTAEPGSRTSVKYLGRGKAAKGKSKPHLFEVMFGKPVEPSEDNN